MRHIVDWIVAAMILAAGSAMAFSSIPPDQGVPVVDAHNLARWPAVVVPAADPEPAPPLTLPDESWCEPLVPLPCDPGIARPCPTAPDGTRMQCVRHWFGEADDHVCVVGYPNEDVQRWRAARLRVLVDEICTQRDGCNPDALHGYLSALVLRESTWRPYKAHRLSADLEANQRAWSKYAHIYRDSPAAGDPDRWAAGRGYYGQNAAALLHVWDPTEIPEALCGEVEATLVHLRTARRRLRRLRAGVSCQEREYHGTADGHPRWYDVSLANGGSNPCPGVSGRRLELRRGFERRVRSRGLDPYSKVTERMLGREVPREDQAEFAARVRRKMDAVPQ